MNKMNYEIERKILSNISLSNEEVSIFLKFLCDVIREGNNIFDPMDSDCKKCFEMSQSFGRITLLIFGCDVILLNMKNLLQIPLTHYSNIISFNIDENKKSYLVDMTYSQFFGDKIVLDNGKRVSTENKLCKKIENEDFVKQLRYNGFVELDDYVLEKYIDVFLDFCKIKDNDLAYENMNRLLNDYKVNLRTVRRKIKKIIVYHNYYYFLLYFFQY